MADNSIYGSKFYLTSRAGEQLPTSGKHEPAAKASEPSFSSYVSTAAQTLVTNPNQNAAIRNNALAGLYLGKSSSVNNFNAYMKQVQLSEKLG